MDQFDGGRARSGNFPLLLPPPPQKNWCHSFRSMPPRMQLGGAPLHGFPPHHVGNTSFLHVVLFLFSSPCLGGAEGLHPPFPSPTMFSGGEWKGQRESSLLVVMRKCFCSGQELGIPSFPQYLGLHAPQPNALSNGLVSLFDDEVRPPLRLFFSFSPFSNRLLSSLKDSGRFFLRGRRLFPLFFPGVEKLFFPSFLSYPQQAIKTLRDEYECRFCFFPTH